MESLVENISNIEMHIGELRRKYHKDNSSHQKGTPFKMHGIKRAPGSGIPSDLIAHQQGVYQCDGHENYIVTGSVKGNPSYFYIIKAGYGCKCNAGKDYWPIETVMTHPGGIQVAENILVIGNEQYSGASTKGDRSNIRFFNIADESLVYELEHLLIKREGKGKIASAVALTKNGEQWVLLIRDGNGIDFYCLDGDIENKDSRFYFIGNLDKKTYDLKDFQNIQIFPSDPIPYYLFGMPDGTTNTDKCWIYKINFVFDDNGKIISISNAELYTMIHFERKGNGPRFKYGAGVSFRDISFQVTSIAGHVADDNIQCNRWI